MDFLQLMMKASREDKAGTAGGEQEEREEKPLEQEETQEGNQSEFKGKGKLTVSQYIVRYVLLCVTQSPL